MSRQTITISAGLEKRMHEAYLIGGAGSLVSALSESDEYFNALVKIMMRIIPAPTDVEEDDWARGFAKCRERMMREMKNIAKEMQP